MAYNSRRGAGGYGGYGRRGGGGRFNNGDGNRAWPGSTKPWVTSFSSNGSSSRQTQQRWHPNSMKIKQFFFRPKCELCKALFHSRLEMDKHKLTAGHLKKVSEMRNVKYPHLKNDEVDLIDLLRIEEEKNKDHDQIWPVTKKYEMLSDCDATKLKSELDGGSGAIHHYSGKKGSTIAETNLPATATTITANVKEQEEESLEKKKDEVMDTSDIMATEEETILEDASADRSLIEDNANKLATSKENQLANYDPNVTRGREFLVPSKGFMCRLCHCFFLDEEHILNHCETESHLIKYTIMTKMKEASSRGKKRGIDQVFDMAENAFENEDLNSTNAVSERFEIDPELNKDVKRIKLKNVELREENNQMDAGERQLNVAVEIAEKCVIGDKPAEFVEPSTMSVTAQVTVPTMVTVSDPVALNRVVKKIKLENVKIKEENTQINRVSNSASYSTNCGYSIKSSCSTISSTRYRTLGSSYNTK